MGVLMRGFTEGLKVHLSHDPSGAQLYTVPPRDNGGDGSAFSPTDLCAASLGACAATVMQLHASRNQIPVSGIRFQLEKEMQASPRTISLLTLRFEISTTCSDAQFAALEEVGRNCPVRLALGPLTQVEQVYVRV